MNKLKQSDMVNDVAYLCMGGSRDGQNIALPGHFGIGHKVNVVKADNGCVTAHESLNRTREEAMVKIETYEVLSDFRLCYVSESN